LKCAVKYHFQQYLLLMILKISSKFQLNQFWKLWLIQETQVLAGTVDLKSSWLLNTQILQITKISKECTTPHLTSCNTLILMISTVKIGLKIKFTFSVPCSVLKWSQTGRGIKNARKTFWLTRFDSVVIMVIWIITKTWSVNLNMHLLKKRTVKTCQKNGIHVIFMFAIKGMSKVTQTASIF